MWHLLLLLPPMIAMLVALYRVNGEEVKLRRSVQVGVFMLLAVYFTIQDILDLTGCYPFVGAKIIHDVSATLLVPFAYMYFGNLLKLPKARYYTRLMLRLTVFMLPEVVTGLFSIGHAEMLDRSVKTSFLRVSVAPDVFIDFQIYSVIVLVQICIVFWRIVLLQRLLALRQLYVTKSVKRMVVVLLMVTMWIIVSLIPSHNAYADTFYNTILMCGYSFVITLAYAFLAVAADVDLVMDRENNPVDIENDSDMQLAMDIQHVIDHNKVYLNPNLLLEDLAEMVLSNRTYVARVFRLRFKGTFTEVMNRYRVEHAQQLMLKNPRMRIDEVALSSGFSSSSFFGRVFKGQVGMTPSQWRSEQREKK